MEKMYQDYKDIAEFRLVYIKEAHAMDSSWPVEYAKEMGIKEHASYGERCSVATKLLSDKNLHIPTLADDMEDTANKAYKGWPDRIFLVRKDGNLAVAAKRGPWGFKPGIDAANTWLAGYKETGKEPPIQKESADASATTDPAPEAKDRGQRLSNNAAAKIVGTWDMQTEYQGSKIPATMSLVLDDGHLIGTWASQGMKMKMSSILLDGDKLSFKRSMGEDGPSLAFSGRVEGDKLDGKYETQFGGLTCAGTRKPTVQAAPRD